MGVIKKWWLRFLLLMSACVAVIIGSSIREEQFFTCVMGVDLLGATPAQCLWVIETMGPSEDLLLLVEEEWSLSAVLSYPTPETLALAQLLIDHGIDVNSPQRVNGVEIPTIHGAILSRELEAFNLLIKNGVDINQVYSGTEDNALQFAYRLQKKRESAELGKMIATLESMQ